MKYSFFIIFLVISSLVHSQIQFWTKDDMLDKQFQQARKELKIKAAYNFITSENWQVNDSTDHYEIFEYDREGRKTTYKKYKTDWAKKKKYFIYIDSFFYNEKGILTGMRRYNPKGNNDYYALEYQAIAVLNGKGQTIKMNFYTGYNATELDKYDTYTYDNKNRIIKITAYSKDNKREYEWKLEYDAIGRLIKVRAGMPGEGFTDHIIKYNAKGLMSSYSELYNGKEKEGETLYVYDDKNRLLRKDHKTNNTYTDTTQYWYRNDEKFYYRTYLKYPGPYGSDRDFSHEFRSYKFEHHQ